MRDAIYARSNGMCDVCSVWVPRNGAWLPHHRRPRSQGGMDTLANLLMLCSSSDRHVAIAPEWSYRLGFTLHDGEDPGTVPVFRWDGWYSPGETWVPCAPGRPTHNLEVPHPSFYEVENFDVEPTDFPGRISNAIQAAIDTNRGALSTHAEGSPAGHAARVALRQHLMDWSSLQHALTLGTERYKQVYQSETIVANIAARYGVGHP